MAFPRSKMIDFPFSGLNSTEHEALMSAQQLQSGSSNSAGPSAKAQFDCCQPAEHSLVQVGETQTLCACGSAASTANDKSNGLKTDVGQVNENGNAKPMIEDSITFIKEGDCPDISLVNPELNAKQLRRYQNS